MDAADQIRQANELAIGEWLTTTVQHILDDGTPFRIRSEYSPQPPSTEFCLLLPESGLWKIVGKQGRHARGIRMFLGTFGQKHKVHYGFQVEARSAESLVEHGVCRFCGCTETKPCNLEEPIQFYSGTAVVWRHFTCAWLDTSRTVCSNPECMRRLAASEAGKMEASQMLQQLNQTK